MAIGIGRREFISALGGATVAWPLVARSEEPDRLRHIGVVMPMAEGDPAGPPRVTALQAALQELGWTTGKNIKIDYRWGAADADRFRSFASELVSQSPELVLVTGMPALTALWNETRKIPILFVLVVDPVTTGFVVSLAKPGGNVTGFTNFEPPMIGKWLELLKDVYPRLAHALLLFDPDTTPSESFLSLLEASSTKLTVHSTAALVHNRTDIERAISSFAGEADGGLVALPCPTTLVNREQIVALAAQNRLPAIYPYDYFARSGGLMSYGVDVVGVYRQAATYIDRILRGANPGDLPVQAPNKFDFVINLSTAKTLGVSIPPDLLASADEVIE
jgi:putative ABC transport system substrate-binding protein